MDKLFLTIVNMSLIGAFVIAAICLARIPLKRAPKAISYCLWLVAGFRLLVPFSIESVFSLIPFQTQVIPVDLTQQPERYFASEASGSASPISTINGATSSNLTTLGLNTSSVLNLINVASVIRLIGFVLLLAYEIASYCMLRRKVSNAAHIANNLYEVDKIRSPFVFGLLSPKIYVPTGLTHQELLHIYSHESTHIRRHDYLVKMFGYFALCLHWFNPLVWLAFRLMCADMEMSCDESVLKEISSEDQKSYLLCLVAMATDRRTITSPTAFGEGSVEGRIKNMLSSKKMSKVFVALSAMFALTLSVGFALNARADEGLPQDGTSELSGNATSETLVMS